MPSLSVGLVEAGEIIGSPAAAAACAAGTEAPEQPAPMIASTPSPSNAPRVRCSIAVRLSDASHFESMYEKLSCVLGNKWSAKPSLLLLISRSAW
eukprot:4324782-Prymnesium_polylepis.1